MKNDSSEAEEDVTKAAPLFKQTTSLRKDRGQVQPIVSLHINSAPEKVAYRVMSL